MAEIKLGDISTWLAPDGVVYRVRVISMGADSSGRNVFEGYRVGEDNEVLKNEHGFTYPVFEGSLSSLGG
jgi:hypothetical protein